MRSKLSRNSAALRAVLRDLATALIVKERIITTHSKAKETQKMVEKLITLGKKGDINARRLARTYLRDVETDTKGETVLTKLFQTVAPRFKNRNGGYTRIIKTVGRKGDNAPMSILEFV